MYALSPLICFTITGALKASEAVLNERSWWRPHIYHEEDQVRQHIFRLKQQCENHSELLVKSESIVISHWKLFLRRGYMFFCLGHSECSYRVAGIPVKSGTPLYFYQAPCACQPRSQFLIIAHTRFFQRGSRNMAHILRIPCRHKCCRRCSPERRSNYKLIRSRSPWWIIVEWINWLETLNSGEILMTRMWMSEVFW